MPQIPQIGDSTGKSYSTSLNSNRGSSGGEQQFTVDGSQKPEQLQVVSDKNAGSNAQASMGQKDLIPLAVTVSKNQALAVETIKDIINADLLNTAKLNGYTELAGELENLSNSLYIPAERLLEEMLEQENQNTMFINDKFYDLLREASVGANPDLKEAIGNMLKAINFSQNKDEITAALTSNLRFLSEYFSPNRALSEKLQSLAERWSSGEAGTNFAALRGETADLLKNVSESLLNDSHTQTLLPIVIHNISKYNTNDSMLREYFGQLLAQIPSYEMRSELSKAFESLLSKLMGNESDRGNDVQSGHIETPAPAAQTPESGSPAQLAEQPAGQTAEQSVGQTAERSADQSAEPPVAQSARDVKTEEQPTGGQLPQTKPETEGQTTPFSNYTINGEKNQVENPIFSKENGNFQIFSDYLSRILSDEEYISGSGGESPDFSSYITALHRRQASGVQIISALVSELIPDKEYRNAVLGQVNGAQTMQELVNVLNQLLEAMPDGAVRDSVFDVLDEAIGVIAEENQLPSGEEAAAQPQAEAAGQQGKAASSIQALTDFISKNINHPALKSIDSFNASNLLQSMINAPGVMTPLSHFILPIQVENTRAFGELWVDNDDEPEGGASAGGGKHYHMFLTFDVDAFGRFEADVYANDSKISVSLLHPPSFGKNIDQMISKINRIAADAGYTVSRFDTGVLKKPHNLTQVFPKLIERRAGLNVQA